MRVHRYRVRQDPTLDELYGEGDPSAVAGFLDVLEREHPDVVHLHAFTAGASLGVLRAASAFGAATVLSFHTPTVSCLRGTLLHEGRTPCDGEVLRVRCAACVLGKHGAPPVMRWMLSRTPVPIARGVGRLLRGGRAATAVRMPELVMLRQAALRGALQEVDAIVATSDWVRTLLLRNGAPAEKIVVSRVGIELAEPAQAKLVTRGAGTALRAIALGRLDRAKGLHVAIAALRGARDLDVTLDVYVSGDGPAEGMYLAELHAAAAGDDRIRILPALPARDVISTMGRYDVTLVPSQGYETGPLVVLESFAAGVPVVGSALGGIAELVRDGIDGLLLPTGSVAAWRDALARLASSATERARLRAGVRPARTVAQAANEMAVLYRRLREVAVPAQVEVARLSR
jgi:glycosyltransferase involved in cell wall biosynthesis